MLVAPDDFLADELPGWVPLWIAGRYLAISGSRLESREAFRADPTVA